MLMKTRMDLKPETSVKTKTTFVLKIAAAVGILGAIVTGVFFMISYFGTPKTTLAGGGHGHHDDDDDDEITNTTYQQYKTVIISECAFKGHDGQKRDEFIELYNLSDTVINLSGYQLEYYESNKNPDIVTLSGILYPDSFFVIAVRNGSGSNKKPTSNLDYDIIVPSNGWKLDQDGYFILKKGSLIVDYAGSLNYKFSKDKNYDRTDVLVSGESVNSDWTEVNNNNSTPGSLNFSDLPTVASVNTVGTAVNFGSNSDNDPAVSIKPNGIVLPGAVTVKVKRGKQPNASFNMIKRSVDINPTTQPDNVELVFYYHPSELNGLSESDLALYSFYANQWHYVGGVVDSVNNKITATGVNHFSTWSAGSKNNGTLPISLLSFTGEYSGKSVILTWKTASEVNNDFFTIEHSRDGINYELLGTQLGAGNSVKVLTYTLTDDNPFKDLTYYRLKQTDYDGKFEYFPAIAIRNNIVATDITIEKFGPNPFINDVSIQFNSNIKGNVLLRLYTMQGSVLRSVDYQCQMGSNTILLNDLGNLKTGTYFVQISTSSYSTKAIRLIKN